MCGLMWLDVAEVTEAGGDLRRKLEEWELEVWELEVWAWAEERRRRAASPAWRD